MTILPMTDAPAQRRRYPALSLATFAVILAAWCVLSYGGFVKPMFMPTPTAVLQSAWKMLQDGTLAAHCWESTRRVMVGWLWSAALALPVGMLMCFVKRVSAVFQPIIEFVRYLPVVALVPLTLLYLGIGESQKYTVIFLGTFFQLALMVADTVSSVERNQVNAARTLGANRLQLYLFVIFPASLPGLMDDFRVTVGWAWTYLVVAEMVAASTGLGYIILKSQRFLATDVIFTGLIMIGLIGLATDLAFRALTKLVVPWHDRLGD